MTISYPAVVVRERRQYWAYVPDLPGVYGRGRTAEESKRDLRAALELYLEDCKADGAPLPRSEARIVEIDQVAVKA